jgi:hypothetical protein
MSDETIKRILGTWRLVSAVLHNLDTGAKSYTMGPQANGYINYGADGRMIVITVGGPRPKPAGAVPTATEKQALYDSLNSYAGTYSLEGEMLTHHVDTSWNEMWTGGDQKRSLKFVGENLQLSGQPTLNGDGHKTVRVMTWERVT